MENAKAWMLGRIAEVADKGRKGGARTAMTMEEHDDDDDDDEARPCFTVTGNSIALS